MMPRLKLRRRDLLHETSEIAGCRSYAHRDGPERLEAPEVVPEVESENPGSGLLGDCSHPAETIHKEVIPLDSAPGPIKEMQERRRRKRRVLPEPPIPTFIMVSPGRYVRAEEPATLTVGTPEGAVEDGAALENLETAKDSISTAEGSTPGVGEGHTDHESGSSTSSGEDPESGTGIDDVRADGPPFGAQEAGGSAVGLRSGAVDFVETDPQDPIKTTSGGCAGVDLGRPEDGEARLGQGQCTEQPEGIGDVPEQGVPAEGQGQLVTEP
jgi:hypothetical protein